LVQLEEWRGKFEAIGVKVAAITYDSRDILSGFHSTEALAFPLLQDVEAKHVNALGVRNEDYPADHQNYGIPHPGILFIGSDGSIKAKYAVPGYRRRPPFDTLYADIESLVK
jgi:peroxiredoxin